MASQYDAVASRTLATITRKGGDVTIARVGAGPGSVYDPITDTWSGDPAASATGKAVQIPQSTSDAERFAAQGLVLVDPITLMIAAKGLTLAPEPGDTITWGDETRTIKDVQVVNPDGKAPVLYTVTGSR